MPVVLLIAVKKAVKDIPVKEIAASPSLSALSVARPFSPPFLSRRISLSSLFLNYVHGRCCVPAVPVVIVVVRPRRGCEGKGGGTGSRANECGRRRKDWPR
ncbi:hypothetical protein PUN28_009189 [Cardiocondyla obscurior]|uniref:Uncharacterized protein n=1 Tax=Cardiocondyla obscurior TaxID=286306 RepID=A0AAW2FWF6_9HYME